MITGVVHEGEARVRLLLRGPLGNEREISAVVDTGYTGWLTLPSAVVTALDLPWQSVARGALADGSERLFDVYEATVIWDNAPRRIPIDEAESDPLLGMALLNGYELNMAVSPGGEVTIRPLA